MVQVLCAQSSPQARTSSSCVNSTAASTLASHAASKKTAPKASTPCATPKKKWSASHALDSNLRVTVRRNSPASTKPTCSKSCACGAIPSSTCTNASTRISSSSTTTSTHTPCTL